MNRDYDEGVRDDNAYFTGYEVEKTSLLIWTHYL